MQDVLIPELKLKKDRKSTLDIFAEALVDDENEDLGTSYINEDGDLVVVESKKDNLSADTDKVAAFEKVLNDLIGGHAKVLFCSLLGTVNEYDTDERLELTTKVLAAIGDQMQKQDGGFDEIMSEKASMTINQKIDVATKLIAVNNLNPIVKNELDKYSDAIENKNWIECTYNREIKMAVNLKTGDFYYELLT